MRTFKDLVTEQTETVVFTFGRFNPPTTGHEKLIKKVASVAGSNPFRIYPSHSQDPQKNPLPHSLKVAYMRQMFKRYGNSIVADRSVKTAIDCAVKLYDDGFKNVTMVVGSDRVAEFKKLLNQYNGVEGKRHGFYEFESISVVSAGERDPDAEDVSGMSASKMRAAAADGDKDAFMTGLPSGFRDGEKLYRDVRKHMGIREERDMGDMTDFENVRDMYLTGKIWNAGDIIEAKGITGEVVRKGTNYLSFVDESGKVHKAWLHEVKVYDEGILDKIKRVKDVARDKMEKLKRALSTETSETKKMLKIYKNRKTASKSDIKFANDQFKDILKGLGLVTLSAVPVPGGGLLIAALTTVAKKKFNINILPSAFYEENAPLIIGDKTKLFEEDSQKEQELDEMSWYLRLKNKIDQMTHPKGMEDMVQDYIELAKKRLGKQDRDFGAITTNTASKLAADIANQYGQSPRGFVEYINTLIKKGKLPKELAAEYKPQNETMSFKSFVDQIQINEKLGKNADMGDYIDDFQKSDAPQFKGKSKEKRKDMAIAAYLDKKDKSEGAYGYEKQDPDIKGKKGTQPAKYHKGLSKSTKQKRDAHFKAKKSGPAPGDATGKTKPSVHTKKFKQMFGEEPRIPRKKGQPAGSDKHSDLYTDENPVGTIHGLGFKDVKTAKASVKKIIGSGKTHAHKIQAAIAMEQRAKEMGKTAEAAVYRKYIEKMKKKTKEMQKEDIDIAGLRTQLVKKMFSKQKYDVHHSNFSSVIQHIADMAKKLYGITIDPKTVTDTTKSKNVPKAGVTKKFSLKGDKGNVKAFVYNRGGALADKPFELRMYQEDLETNEELDESLWANIHKKRQRIKGGSGERMRKKGEKGAPTPAQMKRAKGEEIEEKAPDTADAMKRYKAGKAGFTDIAHLKAKGLIKRSDGTKRKSDKYK